MHHRAIPPIEIVPDVFAPVDIGHCLPHGNCYCISSGRTHYTRQYIGVQFVIYLAFPDAFLSHIQYIMDILLYYFIIRKNACFQLQLLYRHDYGY